MERNNLSIFILRLSLRSFSIFLLIYNRSYPFESLYFYPYLSTIYPCISFSIFHLSAIILFFISSWIFNYHILFEYQSLYSSLSPAYPSLSFSILCQSRILLIFFNLYIFISTLILFYLFCKINHLYPSESQCLYPSLSQAYLRLSFSIFWQSRILPIFLNLYLLIHMNPFLSFLQYKSPLSFSIPMSLSNSIPQFSTSIFFYPLAI